VPIATFVIKLGLLYRFCGFKGASQNFLMEFSMNIVFKIKNVDKNNIDKNVGNVAGINM